MMEIPMAEDFYTLQGEGKYVGYPAVFCRMAHCNLRCGATETDLDEVDEDFEPDGDATWRCDTIEEWREESYTATPSELVEHFEDEGYLERFSNGAHLVLTGGEPTLPARQRQLGELRQELQDRGVDVFVEVETNGTIPPSVDSFVSFVNQWNVSMKLSNSGHSEVRRVNEDAIEFHIEESDSSVFKFVVSRDEDVQEILELQERFGIPDDMIMLMPAGLSQEQIGETYPTVAELCKEQNWLFSQRLHIELWNEKTGV